MAKCSTLKKVEFKGIEQSYFYEGYEKKTANTLSIHRTISWALLGRYLGGSWAVLGRSNSFPVVHSAFKAANKLPNKLPNKLKYNRNSVVVTPQLPHSYPTVTPQLMKVITVIRDNMMSAKEIMECIKLKDKTYFLDKYLWLIWKIE